MCYFHYLVDTKKVSSKNFKKKKKKEKNDVNILQSHNSVMAIVQKERRAEETLGWLYIQEGASL